MVHFSGFARKMNHLSSFYVSEASAKMPFNAYFEFMYGFKIFFITHISWSVSVRFNFDNQIRATFNDSLDYV
ncbi:MAG: hypothetical protein U5L45_06875 [Saprospiraceae bacterium]|nr:hypothetical protein [Saprospiraceae bacterium]